MRRSWGKTIHPQSASWFRQRTGAEPTTPTAAWEYSTTERTQATPCVLFLAAYCPLMAKYENNSFLFSAFYFLENFRNNHWLCPSEISGRAAVRSPNGVRKMLPMPGTCLFLWSQTGHLLKQRRFETYYLSWRAVGSEPPWPHPQASSDSSLENKHPSPLGRQLIFDLLTTVRYSEIKIKIF